MVRKGAYLSSSIDISRELQRINKLIFVQDYEKAKLKIDELACIDSAKYDPFLQHRRIELAGKIGPDAKSQLDQEFSSNQEKGDQKGKIFRYLIFLNELHNNQDADLESIGKHLDHLVQEGSQDFLLFYTLGFCRELSQNWTSARHNYQKSLELKPDWYPSCFGLSQCFYQLGQDDQGDQYFYQYEQSAPFNIYGNFETHRKLSAEYRLSEEYEYAERAITTLSEWWEENKGFCPRELLIFEKFALSRIYEDKSDLPRVNDYRMQAMAMCDRILREPNSTEHMLFFIAKILEEFSELELSVEFYYAILKLENKSSDVTQKIASQFFAMGDYNLGHTLFERAYKHQPDHPEIRFFYLISKLRLAEVDVEEYLAAKQRMKDLAESSLDSVELLSLLHSLKSRFLDDPEVHETLGDIYVRIENYDQASICYERMLECDSHSLSAKLKYASFYGHMKKFSAVKAILNEISNIDSFSESQKVEVLWLKSLVSFHDRDFEKAVANLNNVINLDSWNVNYIVQKCLALSEVASAKLGFQTRDSVLNQLANSDEKKLNWAEFDKMTRKLSDVRQAALVYERERIRFLYSMNADEATMRLFEAAKRYDCKKAFTHFLRLLNTNFDSPQIQYILGLLQKELWQLESAVTWFDQVFEHPQVNDSYKAKAYREIADCYIWLEINIDKAVEFARISVDLGGSSDTRALLVLAHALLKAGQIREAAVFLDNIETQNDIEAIYLKGLVSYRNGALEKANEIWKPLITRRTEDLRAHIIKEHLMEYYFERKAYRNTH